MRKFWWQRNRLTPHEMAQTEDLARTAKALEERTAELREESAVVGERQRQIRRDNHFGRTLSITFRGNS